MKQILVTVKQLMEVPDSFELGNHLKNAPDWNVIKVGSKIAVPEITWSKWEDDGDGPSIITQSKDSVLTKRLDRFVSLDWSMTEFPMNYEVPTEC
jgi:hypothetical protein